MKKRYQQKKRSLGLEVNGESVRTLRSLSDEEAFHFYAAVGEPTGEIAGSLSDFLEKAKSVRLESLAFHLQRRDFQNWVETTLGDSKLARRISRISPSCDDGLRRKLCTAVEIRIKELTEAPQTDFVGEGLALVSASLVH